MVLKDTTPTHQQYLTTDCVLKWVSLTRKSALSYINHLNAPPGLARNPGPRILSPVHSRANTVPKLLPIVILFWKLPYLHCNYGHFISLKQSIAWWHDYLVPFLFQRTKAHISRQARYENISNNLCRPSCFGNCAQNVPLFIFYVFKYTNQSFLSYVFCINGRHTRIIKKTPEQIQQKYLNCFLGAVYEICNVAT